MSESDYKESFINSPSTKWTEGYGKDSDIIISSRIRLARNLAETPFPQNSKPEAAKKIIQKVDEALSQSAKKQYEMLYMEDLQELERDMLVEKHLISPALAKKNTAGVSIRNDEGVAVMVNEEDHLRIQCFMPALQLEEAWNLANKVDNLLAEKLNFAYHEHLGYLTACPTNTGTGLRASVMLHLPLLTLSQEIKGIFAKVGKLGLAVRGIYGEESEIVGNLYQISNQVTLGLSEEEIISNLSDVVGQIIALERKARENMEKQYSRTIYDKVWRSYGIMHYAQSMSSVEMLSQISYLRLGMDMGILPNLSARFLNEMMVLGQPAFLQKQSGKPLLPEERDWERASMIRKKMQELER